MTLEQIKNDYAVSKGHNNFCDIIFDFDGMDIDEVSEHIDQVMKIYAMECLKLASENATMKVEYPDECYSESNEYGEKFVNSYDVECGGEYVNITIEKESITNEKNIIK